MLYPYLLLALLLHGSLVESKDGDLLTVNCTSICDQVELTYDNEAAKGDAQYRHNNCMEGCSYWPESTTSSSSCQNVCHKTAGWFGGENIGCTLGCVFATQFYVSKIRDLIGEPGAPELVGNMIDSTSVGIRWTSSNYVPGIQYLVQYRQSTGTGEWQYHNPDHLLTDTQIRVTDLKPYTKYQFRIAWIILPSQPPILSDFSPWISTLPSGPPQSPPRNVRAIPMDWNRVEVSWDAPLYPGGDLITYTVYLRQKKIRNEIRKDVEAHGDRRFVVTGLKQNTTYQLELTATNHKGEGPPALLQVTTYPSTQNIVDDGRGYLLLTSGPTLFRLGLDFMEQSKFLFNTSSGLDISGLAVHIPLKFIYISDTNGIVYQIYLGVGHKNQRVLLTPQMLGGQAVELSVDWLFGNLFLAVETPNDWQIWKCDLMGKNLSLVAHGLPEEPKNLMADPYNGYIWWMSKGIESGLHRLPLYSNPSAMISTIVYHYEHMGGLTLDAPNFRVLVADQSKNSMLAISLDGTSVIDLRNNTQQAFFHNVTSLTYLNDKFFWTNGNEVFTEELNEGTFYHNSYALDTGGIFSHLLAMHRSGQPIPIPLNPPRSVQALFAGSSVTITWNKPLLPVLMGSGAWQDWKYEVHVQVGEKILSNDGIEDTELFVKNLSPSTSYNIKVRAYSKRGEGPWSTIFLGRSLGIDDESNILWLTDEGLLRTNLDGKESIRLNLGSRLRGKIRESISHIAYYEDFAIVSVKNDDCLLVNVTSGDTEVLKGMKGIHATAVDWATGRVFGVHPRNNTIIWKYLNQPSHGTLNLMTVALGVEVDSYRGLLYWRTRSGVFKSTLAGRNITELHQENLFSGKLVRGLALDVNSNQVWWGVRDESGFHLFNSQNNDSYTVDHSIQEGTLKFVGERLLWETDEGNLIVFDPVRRSEAIVKSHNLKVLQIAGHIKRPTFTSSNLLPTTLNPSVISVNGTWKQFQFVWEPLLKPRLDSSQGSNVGNLHYEVTILGQKERASFVTLDSWVAVPWSVDPYSRLKVIMRAITNWAVGEHTIVHLRTPSALPSEPTKLRIFKSAKRENEYVFRWNPPKIPNGEIIKYKLEYCSENSSCDSVFVDGYKNEHRKSLLLDQFQLFHVSAFTTVGEGPSKMLNMTSNPIMFPPTQIPSLFVVSESSIVYLDADDGTADSFVANATRISSGIISFNSNRLIWLDHHSYIISFELENKGNSLKRVERLDGFGSSLSLDWVAETIYWIENSDKQGASIRSYDLSFETKRTILSYSSSIRVPRQVIVAPTKDLLYILEEVNLVSSIKVYPFNKKTSFDLFDDTTRRNPSKNCSCPKSASLGPSFTLDSTSLDDPKIYFTLNENSYEGHLKSSVLVSDSIGCNCKLVVLLSDYNYDTCDQMAVDEDHFYCYSGTKKMLLWMPKEGPLTKDLLFNREIESSLVRNLLPSSQATQPMPSLACLIISNHDQSPSMSLSLESSLSLHLPKPSPKCDSVSFPPYISILYFEKANTSCGSNINVCNEMATINESVTISELEPFTDYVFRIAFKTIYNSRFNISLQPGPPTVFRTRAKAPLSAIGLQSSAISPEEIKVIFVVPTASPFEVHWRNQKGEKNLSRLKHTKTDSQEVALLIKNLLPNSKYAIWVRVHSKDDIDQFTDSPKSSSVTFPAPPDIHLIRANSTILQVQWTAPSVTKIIRHSVEFKEESNAEWKQEPIQKTLVDHAYNYNISSLQPASTYHFRLNLIYNTTEHNSFIWPNLPSVFKFNTTGAPPGPPGLVRLQKSNGGVDYEAWWAPSERNGRPVIFYELQMAIVAKRGWKDQKFTFEPVYNGSEPSWMVTIDFDANLNYLFRVRGINDLGVGKWSVSSDLRSPVGTSRLSTVHLPTVLGATIPACLMLLAVLLTCLTMGIRRASDKSHKDKNSSITHNSMSGVELASLPHLPTNNNFVSENNILYTMQNFPGEEVDLPCVPSRTITRAKFLGSGAFGDVYEGTASKLPGRNGSTKVAIKTLRKGATEQEKSEFLKEAQLMSHFQHEHILRLLAVCTDHDPFFLILELMQGGDLLSYLRASRGSRDGFTLLHLLNMCVDVAKGCVYLEEMHFVHRDIAARNCLVSSTDPLERIVKIGDFGLARDIYKNDYYRKEGEGLLPVRWMPPESLIDGVFTTQSDVWAFGVLLWEIMTLGQQPYPARTNLEVLHYVRNGGKPLKPQNCPEDLQALTERCWTYNPDARPTFKECLNVLLVIQENVASLPHLAVHNANYMSANRICGLDNLAYATDRAENSDTFPLRRYSWNEDFQPLGLEAQSTSGASTLPLTAPLDVPYLQLETSRGSDSTIPCDSYEIPISLNNRDFSSLSTELTSIASYAQPDVPTLRSVPEDLYSPDHSLSTISIDPPSLNASPAKPSVLFSHDYCPPFRRGSDQRNSIPCSSLSSSSFMRKNSLPSSFHRKRDMFLPSSPRSPNSLLTPCSMQDSPTRSITFTFPQIRSPSKYHYLHHVNNQCVSTEDDINASPPDIPSSSGYNSYVSMSAGADQSLRDGTAEGSFVNRESFSSCNDGFIRGVDLSFNPSYTNC